MLPIKLTCKTLDGDSRTFQIMKTPIQRRTLWQVIHLDEKMLPYEDKGIWDLISQDGTVLMCYNQSEEYASQIVTLPKETCILLLADFHPKLLREEKYIIMSWKLDSCRFKEYLLRNPNVSPGETCQLLNMHEHNLLKIMNELQASM